MASSPVAFSRAEDDALAAAHLAFRPDKALTMIAQPELHNIIGRTFFYDPSYDPMRAVGLFRDADYPRSSFPSCTVRFRTPRGATVRFFCEGKMTCCGTSSLAALTYAFQKTRAKLERDGMLDVDMRWLVCENHVYGYDVGRRLNIADIEYEDELRSVFQPETFPGLVYKLEDPSMKLLIFESGRIMLTGVRKPQYVREGIDQVNRFLADIIARDASAGSAPRAAPRRRGKADATGAGGGGRKELRQRGSRMTKALRNIEKRSNGQRHSVAELKRLCAEEMARIEAAEVEKQRKVAEARARAALALAGGGAAAARARGRADDEDDDEDDAEGRARKRAKKSRKAAAAVAEPEAPVEDMPDLGAIAPEARAAALAAAFMAAPPSARARD